MEVRPTPANLAQVTAARDGEWVQITDDVQNVANDLAEIDHHIRLRYSDTGDYFVVYWLPDGEEEGNGDLITTAQELDQRIVTRVRELYAKTLEPGYSFADELEAEQRRKEAAQDAAFTEAHGEMYERLMHAMKKDKGIKDKVLIPKGVDGSSSKS